MRIDKFLANRAYGSRKEVHDLLKKRFVTVNGEIITKKDFSINLDTDSIKVNGFEVPKQEMFYIKFHKPAGLITAVDDVSHRTVMDVLPPEYKKMGVFPVGRLDKDTEGLLLLTNDGVWAHKVINGRKHVPKVYYLEFNGELSEDGLRRIREGILLGDGTQCKPAEIFLINDSSARITIEEGKYHQVKRMIGAAGGTVTYLKRESIGDITLDDIKETTQYIDLSENEVNLFI